MSAARHDADAWTDERLLRALHPCDHERMTMAAIGQALGVSRSSVCGALKRIRDDEQPCACVKPQNRDGGMRPLWWKRGR